MLLAAASLAEALGMKASCLEVAARLRYGRCSLQAFLAAILLGRACDCLFIHLFITRVMTIYSIISRESLTLS